MIPLKDDVPYQRFPIGTVALIAANVLAFLWEIGSPDPAHFEAAIRLYGAIPSHIAHLGSYSGHATVPPLWTIVTAMFLHGGVAHIAGNMLFLWVFGHTVEGAMGSLRYLLFYFIGGIAAAAAQIALMPNSRIPMVGASGAIAGVLGAYFVLFPRARVLTLIPIFVFVRLVYLPALIFLGLWFLMQLFSVPEALGGGPGVAFLAHIGGFVAGLALGRVFAKAPRRSVVRVVPRGEYYLN